MVEGFTHTSDGSRKVDGSSKASKETMTKDEAILNSYAFMAMIVSTYYKTLVENGVDKEHAVRLAEKIQDAFRADIDGMFI